MSKFKVGDVVRCIAPSKRGYGGVVGKTYRVLDVFFGDCISIDCYLMSNGRGCDANRFELLTPAPAPAAPAPDRALEWLKHAAQERASWRFDPFGTSYMNALHDMLRDVYGLQVEINQVVELKPIDTKEVA